MAFIYINLSVSISGSEVYICWVHRGLGFILHIYIIHIYIYYILYIYIYIIIYNLGSSPKIRIPVTLTIDCRGISQETTTLTRNIDQYRTNMNQQTTVKVTTCYHPREHISVFNQSCFTVSRENLMLQASPCYSFFTLLLLPSGIST